MNKLLVSSAALMLAAYGAVATAGDVQSGLQPGEKAGAFNVNDCTGPNKGDSLCYR